MTTATTTSTTTAIRRTTGLARANALLMLRNNLTMAYALILPLLPMALLLTGERGDVEIGMTAVGSALMLALLFSVYYNLLSSMVTRRDELVLKRLRTGETRDSELLLSMALPGVTVTLVLSVVLIGLGAALGLPLPLNPLLFAATILVASAAFASLAIWTAAWTRNAEAAQMTSVPDHPADRCRSRSSSPTAGAVSSTSPPGQRWTGSCDSPGSDATATQRSTCPRPGRPRDLHCWCSRSGLGSASGWRAGRCAGNRECDQPGVGGDGTLGSGAEEGR